MDLFDFVADPKFRALLERDFEELEKCVEAKASKSVLVLSGSIIEALLVEFFVHNPPGNKTKAQILKMPLNDLIIEASNIGLIKPISKDLSTVVRNYRNLIHPGLEVRQNESFDFDTAVVAYHLVKIIIKEARESYLQKYGYKGLDIYNKILSDSSFYSIFDKPVKKLNDFETKMLFSYLVNHEIDNFSIEVSSPLMKYIEFMKPIMGSDTLTVYCKKLLAEVEGGDEAKALALFDIFGANLDLIATDEQETVLTYVHSFVLTRINPNLKYLFLHRFTHLASILSYHIDLPGIKKNYFDLLLQIIKLYQGDIYKRWNVMQFYKELVSVLTAEKREKCEDFIRTNLPEIGPVFIKAFEDNSDMRYW